MRLSTKYVYITAKIVNFSAMKVKQICLSFIFTLFLGLTVVMAQTDSEKSSSDNETETLNVFMPNAFTPNFDGLNDVIRPVIDGPELEFYEFIVLDRNGKEVFYSTDPKEVWNGSVNGGDYVSSPSIFIYFLKLQTVDGVSPKTYSGHIVMIR